MLNNEEMNRLHREIFGHYCVYRTGVESEIDLDTIKEVQYITENAKALSQEEWNEWYKKNSDNFPVLLAGAKTHLIPRNITKQIINNFEMFKTSYLRGCVIEDETLLQEIITNDISVSDLENVSDKMGQDFPYVLEFYSKNLKNDKEYLEAIPERVKMLIAEKALETFSFSGQPYSNTTIKILNYIQDEEALRKIFIGNDVKFHIHFSATQIENIRTELINNPYLSDEFKDEMFNAGCNWTRLTENSFTPNIVKEIYESCIDTYTELYNLKTNTAKSGWELTYRDAQDMISKLINSDKLPEAMQLDLAMRITDRENKKMDYYVGELFRKTKSEAVLRMADKLKSKDKEYAYSNPCMPKDVLEKRTNEFCTKMTKHLIKGTPEKIPTIWDKHIEIGIMSARIEDEHYKMLMANGKPASQMAIAISEFTPDYIRKNFLTYLNLVDERDLPETYQPEVKVALETLEFIKENKLDETRPFIAEYFDRVGPFTSEINFSNNNARNHYQVGDAIREIDDMCKITSKTNLQKLIDFCKEKADDAFVSPKNTTVKDKEKNIYKFLYHTIVDSLRYVEKMNHYEKTKDASILSNEELIEALRNIRIKTTNETNCVDYFLTLARDGEAMLDIFDEVQKREKEKEKSNIEEESHTI